MGWFCCVHNGAGSKRDHGPRTVANAGTVWVHESIADLNVPVFGVGERRSAAAALTGRAGAK